MITFARNGRYLIPRTDADMLTLTKFNLRLTRYDSEYLPTLKLILSKRDEDVEIVSFQSEVLDPMFEKLETFWSKGKNRIHFDKNEIKLIAPNTDKNLQRLRTIEDKLRVFFERWGYSLQVIPNETKTKCGLTFIYHLSLDHPPIITIGSCEHELDFDPAILEMGDYRLIINRHEKTFGLSFDQRDGSSWKTVKFHSSIPYSKLKSSHMISSLFEMFNM